MTQNSFSLNHYTHPPLSGGKPKQVIVLLHGYGSNGRDLISLAPYWQQSVPDAVFVSPDAPFPCEMAPEFGYQWFPLLERSPEEYLKGAQEAFPIVHKYLDEVLSAYGLKDADMALVGFSQGTMMSLYVGPRREGTIAGILGYSGSLIGGEELDHLNKPPVCLIHGEADSVVFIEKYHAAVKTLTEKGFQVSGHTTPRLEHSIDERGITEGAEFLRQILN